MSNEESADVIVDEVFEEWNQADITVELKKCVETTPEDASPVAGVDFANINKCPDKCLLSSCDSQSVSRQTTNDMSSSDERTPTICIQTQAELESSSKADENQFFQWPTTSSRQLPSIKWNPYSAGGDETKPNVLEVPRLNSQGKSISLANLSTSYFLNPNQLDRYALSVPSSPDSFYCDSLCSSCGGADLNSPTASPLLSRSLSCDVLNVGTGVSIKQSRRSNSSDSAVVMPSEEERMTLQQDQHYFQQLEIKPDLSLDESEKTFACLRLDSVPQRGGGGINGNDDGDQIPSPLFSMPSVVVSDHSDFYRSLDEYSSFNDSLCADSHIQYWHQFRKLSDCSSTTGSITSNPSLDDEEEQQYRLLDDDKCLLPSGWRKVRNIVHWSPFVQTYKKQKYPWIQLAGHKGSFKPGDHGTILKKMCPKEEKCLIRLMKDDLSSFVPEYKGRVVGSDDEMYLKLQDLLKDFDDPCVMDCKIGVRTYLEEELSKAKEKAKLRKDMFDKMIQVDPTAATEEENRMKGVTKPRYMVWRETISSTATLGFRIDGMKRSNGLTSKDFKMTRTVEQVSNSFRIFMEECEQVLPQYIQRLKELKATLERSNFFANHELIGSSLLFVHDKVKANIWMIDFAKTQALPEGIHIDHKTPWDVGNHEDGYLIGIDNLIKIFSSL